MKMEDSGVAPWRDLARPQSAQSPLIENKLSADLGEPGEDQRLPSGAQRNPLKTEALAPPSQAPGPPLRAASITGKNGNASEVEA